jgi:hypothetical protein
MRRGEADLSRWIDYGTEHHLIDDDGHLVARISKLGCCWRAYLGASAMTSGRFRRIEDAKRAVEALLATVHA